MGMTIDIDGSIKELSKWRKDLNYDNGDYCYGDDTTRHSLDVAIETMRKYQKIEQIVGSKAFHIIPDEPNCVDSEHELRIRYNEICEVLADDRNN